MTIQSPHLPLPLEATPETVADVISAIPSNPEGSRFAIVSESSQTYMQALHTPAGFQLEYQEGTIAQHYHCLREDLSASEIIEVLCDYLSGDVFWKRRFQFECRDLRTPYFRAGFRVGQLFGHITDFFGRSKV